MKLCAKKEYCQQDIFKKLMQWGTSLHEANQIISDLISLNFVNEERFAKAYVHDKISLSSWSIAKITLELKRKNISSYSISKALQIVDVEIQRQKIIRLIRKKNELLIHQPLTTRKLKITQYMLRKGYSWEDIQIIVDEITANC